MSKGPPSLVHPDATPTDPHHHPDESKPERYEQPPPPQYQCPSPKNPSQELERKAERRGTTRSGEAWRLQREVGDLRGLVEKQKAEISRLRRVEEILKGKLERREEKISKLDYDLEKTRNGWQEADKVHARQAHGMQELLKRTEELLETRSAELSEAWAFLSTADHLSEMEVLEDLATCPPRDWQEFEAARALKDQEEEIQSDFEQDICKIQEQTKAKSERWIRTEMERMAASYNKTKRAMETEMRVMQEEAYLEMKRVVARHDEEKRRVETEIAALRHDNETRKMEAETRQMQEQARLEIKRLHKQTGGILV